MWPRLIDKAPTSGLKDYVYDCGAPKDAANYSIVTEKLCNHIQATLLAQIHKKVSVT